MNRSFADLRAVVREEPGTAPGASDAFGHRDERRQSPAPTALTESIR